VPAEAPEPRPLTPPLPLVPALAFPEAPGARGWSALSPEQAAESPSASSTSPAKILRSTMKV
jgi:hypothetical protein